MSKAATFYSGARTGLRAGAVVVLAFVSMVLLTGFTLGPALIWITFAPESVWSLVVGMVGTVLWFAVVVLPTMSGVMEVARRKTQDRDDDHYPVGAR